ncbi:hypothetical protein MiSe_94640 [Microseira wollei NIES-4236]|uniref:Uncharacterized protein n=2 Tax=Microseira wollei TaxID=467598 RepID=A0AAV3XPH8_9CYAN|nr:hypothetical protein MiSe_94640 [Microseira wollei NIES-4236]
MPEREKVQFLIISSREGVQEQIRNFYVMGFAQVDEWSPIVPVPNSDRVMTILTRYRQRLASDKSTRKSGR